jgi:hypothetical protein
MRRWPGCTGRVRIYLTRRFEGERKGGLGSCGVNAGRRERKAFFWKMVILEMGCFLGSWADYVRVMKGEFGIYGELCDVMRKGVDVDLRSVGGCGDGMASGSNPNFAGMSLRRGMAVGGGWVAGIWHSFSARPKTPATASTSTTTSAPGHRTPPAIPHEGSASWTTASRP